ncbi:hypothetical protein EMCRGX_G024781 [Ephydatia muelleri]
MAYQWVLEGHLGNGPSERKPIWVLEGHLGNGPSVGTGRSPGEWPISGYWKVTWGMAHQWVLEGHLGNGPSVGTGRSPGEWPISGYWKVTWEMAHQWVLKGHLGNGPSVVTERSPGEWPISGYWKVTWKWPISGYWKVTWGMAYQWVLRGHLGNGPSVGTGRSPGEWPISGEGSFQNLFAKPEQFPQLVAEKQAIRKLQQDLVDYKRQIQRVIGSGFTDYITVSGEKYLVEFKNKDTSKVPTDWLRISSTKAVTRFRPPFVVQMVRLLAQHEDQLIVAAKQAWDEFLLDFSSHYQVYKRSVDHIATLDCLLSLSQVARMPHYVRPKMVDGTQIHITAGRHPVIDQLLPEGRQFVPNGAHLSGDGMRAMIITGPNMGGKSSYIKQVALICILAQIGSWVPAESATLGVLDAIYTRMGASDSIQCCKSTFMVELQEAADIMNQATDRSLVILDELGRGTSTHDGTAVAYASLNYFIEDVRSLVLFVTHYPPLGELESIHPGVVRNYHMAYVEAKDNEEEYDKIVLLYQLEQGQADRSYGLNVAALAGLSSDILKVAAQKAKELHAAVNSDITQHLSHQINPSRLSSFKSIMKLQPGQVGLSESLSSVLGAL